MRNCDTVKDIYTSSSAVPVSAAGTYIENLYINKYTLVKGGLTRGKSYEVNFEIDCGLLLIYVLK